jgi:hypothetical protein
MHQSGGLALDRVHDKRVIAPDARDRHAGGKVDQYVAIGILDTGALALFNHEGAANRRPRRRLYFDRVLDDAPRLGPGEIVGDDLGHVSV